MEDVINSVANTLESRGDFTFVQISSDIDESVQTLVFEFKGETFGMSIERIE